MTFEDLSLLWLDELLESPWSQNTYEKALSTLKNYLMLTGNDDEQCDRPMRLFDEWLGFVDSPLSQWW